VTSHRVPHLRLFEFFCATPVGLAIIVALLAAMFGGAMAAGPDAVGPSGLAAGTPLTARCGWSQASGSCLTLARSPCASAVLQL
jgi:hypothetical protein